MWYYSWNEQPVGPVDPGHLQGLVASGTITANTFVWREGMADWVEARVSELAALFAPGVAVPAGPPPVPGHFAQPLAAAPSHRGFKNFGGLTRSVQVLVVVSAVLTFLASMASVWAIQVGKTMTDVEAYYEAMPLAYWNLLMATGFAMILVYLALVVVFCIWVHRACANAHALGAADLKFTPGWAVGWYFIPIMNCWKPCQAMMEIWKASRSPRAWSEQEDSPLVSGWWTCGILSAIAARAYWRMDLNAETVSAVIQSEYASLIGDLLTVGFHLTTLFLVSRILRMQQARNAEQTAG